ncbi:cytochrome P450 [Rhizobium sp. RAF56]|uniref:cytochrome P450 n=1 Tax=Rhizobium sp. RAF56 TaxID=3233062 RepID=UPI003F95D5BE
MYFGLYEPAPVIENCGDDFFIAAHPQPLQDAPNIVQIVLGARHSLIGNWVEEYYSSCIDSFKILTRQVVFANTPESVKYVLATRHDNYERKSPQMRRALEVLLGDGLFISDGQVWQRRRPLVADIVHKKRLPEFAPSMETVTLALTERWQALPAGHEFNMIAEMAELTAEIISRAVFGRNLGAAAARKVVDGFTRYQKSIDSFNLGYFLGVDDGLPVLRGPKSRNAVKQVHSVVEDVINAHLEGKGDPGSMVDLLVRRNQRNPELGLDVTALRNEAATIFMAGHETTATTLTWVWYLLANAPWVEQAVHDELDRICGERPATMEDLPRLDLCQAVIMEALRLYPPVPLLPRQAKEADEICGVPVEKGALVMIAPWLLHRARDLWDRPTHFLPERFLGGAKPEPYTFLPFSAGPRICAGLNFGLSEAVLCLAILSQRFRVSIRPGYKVSPVCRLTLRPDGGLPVTVTPRERGVRQ